MNVKVSANRPCHQSLWQREVKLAFLKWAASNKAETDLTHQEEEKRPALELINIPVGFEDKRLTPPLLPDMFTGRSFILSGYFQAYKMYL